MKRKLISVSLALALGLSLAACGSKPAPSGAETPAGELGTLSGPVELQFWHSISNQNHLKVLEGLVEEFNETIGAEKGITVVPTFNGSSSELYSSVVGAIKAGSAPDVTLALRPYVADYLQTDYVVNLEPYITDPNVGMTDYEDIFEGLREANSSYAKEGIYSLPIHSYSEVLYYNKTFFAEHGLSVPTTWDELFYPQLGVKLCSMAGGGVQKIYMVFLREPSRRDRSGSDLFHLWDGFEIKMNFDRNVSCFIFVNALMHDDFFD